MINVGIGTGQVLKWDGTGFNTLVQDLQIIDSFSFISS